MNEETTQPLAARKSNDWWRSNWSLNASLATFGSPVASASLTTPPGECRHPPGVHPRHRQQPCGARPQPHCAACNDSENVESGVGISPTALASCTARGIPVHATENGWPRPRNPRLCKRSMRLPAGTTFCGAGWQSVGRLWRAVRGGLVPAGKIAHRISSPAPSATFIGGGFCMHARSQS